LNFWSLKIINFLLTSLLLLFETKLILGPFWRWAFLLLNPHYY
jgi:hypothetical protein